MKKKIILIWDLDGFIGVVNSGYPYNYDSTKHELELNCVEQSLEILASHNIKCTFAITGFSAEEGIYPYTFPNLIHKIYDEGHEIASHSWRHEWIPHFKKEQIEKSLLRSKKSLETICDDNIKVVGFVPPHNKPSTWIKKGAYSFEDQGFYPLHEMGDLSQLLQIVRQTEYKWIRISINPFINRFKKKVFPRIQKVYNYKGTLVFQNHHNGFDERIVKAILERDQEYYVVSAHPIMLSFRDGRPESMERFKIFLENLAHKEEIEFVRPRDILSTFGIS